MIGKKHLKCSNCGKIVPNKFPFCDYCGEKLRHQPKSRKGFFALALVLGVLVLGYWALAPVTQTFSLTPIATPAADQKTFTNSIGMEFVQIPAGEFDMGSPSNEMDNNRDEGPVHRVKIAKSFYMGKYEVTRKQWREVMGSNPSNIIGDNLSVESISWNDVQEFIKKLNQKEGTDKYRLPSEVEWEYAARAGTTTRYSFGDDESKLGDYAGTNPDSKKHEVGQKKPNPWGLYDIHGNVWEWVQDIYHSSYNGAPTDGRAWEGVGSYRVVRGGCAGNCRSADRGWGALDTRNLALGFRIVMDAPASTNASETLQSTSLPTPKVTTTILQTPTVTPTKTTTATPVRLKVVEDVFNGDASAANKAGLEKFENGYYYVVDWQGDKYVALKGKTNKLVKLILEQRNVENKVLTVGENWDIGGGWTVTVE